MRNILALMFFLIAVTTKSNAARKDSISYKAQKLREYFNICKGPNSEFYQKDFFNVFPNSFDEFEQLYGYDDKEGRERILYDHAPDHINLLFNLSTINDTVFYRKIVAIAIGGYWDSDAISIFQEGLRNKTKENADLALFILNRLSDKQIKSFWYFYFDEVHPEKLNADIRVAIQQKDERIFRLMKESYDNVMKNNKEH